MRKRQITEDERELFETALNDAKPLKKSPRRRKKKTAPKAAPPAETALPSPAAKPAPKKQTRAPPGIDGNTADKLRRGALEPQARLDLHGLTERAAHHALVAFLRAAKTRKLRLVLIVTGKGNDPRRELGEQPFDLGLDMQMRGVLRAMTPRWLREPGLAELIADIRQAHRRHGGAGALYVYLRK